MLDTQCSLMMTLHGCLCSYHCFSFRKHASLFLSTNCNLYPGAHAIIGCTRRNKSVS